MHALDEYSPESLDELDDFFEHAPVGLHVGGADGVIRRANRAELHVMGYAECPDEYVGHHVAEFHASEAVIEDMLSRLVGGQQLVNHPATLRRRDGTTLPVRIYSSPRMAGTDFLNTRCLTIPLVDAGQATGAAAPGLRPRPTRLEPVSAWAELHDFFEHAPLGLHVVDAAGIIRRANRVELDTLGYAGAPDEYLGHHIAEFHADQRVIEEMLQTLVGGEPLNDHRARLLRRDGTTLPVRIYSSPRMRDASFVSTRCVTCPDASDVQERRFQWPRNQA